jgi:hypothetical protein
MTMKTKDAEIEAFYTQNSAVSNAKDEARKVKDTHIVEFQAQI